MDIERNSWAPNHADLAYTSSRSSAGRRRCPCRRGSAHFTWRGSRSARACVQDRRNVDLPHPDGPMSTVTRASTARRGRGRSIGRATRLDEPRMNEPGTLLGNRRRALHAASRCRRPTRGTIMWHAPRCRGSDRQAHGRLSKQLHEAVSKHRVKDGRSERRVVLSRACNERPLPTLDDALRRRLVARYGAEVEAWLDELPPVLIDLGRRWGVEFGELNTPRLQDGRHSLRDDRRTAGRAQGVSRPTATR